MFHAGAVLPSSSLLLQLLTDPPEARPPRDRMFLVGLVRPEYAALFRGLKASEGLSAVVLLVPRGLVVAVVVYAGDLGPLEPVPCGLIADPLLFAPMVVGKVEGLRAFALRLKAAMHCITWAGSLESYRSTVRNRSWEGRLRGGSSHARRKCEIFSICTNGILDSLYLTPEGTARLASLDVSCQQVWDTTFAVYHTCKARRRLSEHPSARQAPTSPRE